MKTRKKLDMLWRDYYTSEVYITRTVVWAMDAFERGDIERSWMCLFDWCQAQDDRELVWRRVLQAWLAEHGEPK
jgi:hypothetical protein